MKLVGGEKFVVLYKQNISELLQNLRFLVNRALYYVFVHCGLASSDSWNITLHLILVVAHYIMLTYFSK